jgi:hypothetical protein
MSSQSLEARVATLELAVSDLGNALRVSARAGDARYVEAMAKLEALRVKLDSFERELRALPRTVAEMLEVRGGGEG